MMEEILLKVNLTLVGIIVIMISTSCSTFSMVDSNKNGVYRTPKFTKYDTPPKLVKRVLPLYPESLKKSGIMGDVLLEFEVLSDGSIGEVEVKQSLMPGQDGLDEEAIKAVKQWEFRPAVYKGKPVDCWVSYPVTFKINNNSHLLDNPDFKRPESTPAIQNSEPGTTSKNVIYDKNPEVLVRVEPEDLNFCVRVPRGDYDVYLDVEVFYTGDVGEVIVMKSLMNGPGGYDEAAIKAVKQWKFKPAEYKGKPVSVRVTFPITFTLN